MSALKQPLDFTKEGKKKTHKDSASKGKVSWKFSKSLLSKHLSID